jgi:methylthioribose-1-phosphate isomerase
VRIIDQTLLPSTVAYCDLCTIGEAVEAIRALRVRGAPAIGIAAAYALAVCAERTASSAARVRDDAHGGARVATRSVTARATQRIRTALESAAESLVAARPTAVNLRWAVERMRRVWRCADVAHVSSAAIVGALQREADTILAEDLDMSARMGRAGADLLATVTCVLTHCNTGGLATGGLGTALAVVFAAHAAGKKVSVLADETRPLLQGARLTAWELAERGIPVRVLVDGAAAAALATGMVNTVLIGADRVAANGDTANKIGSYPLAVLAQRHAVPFYVVMPSSTLDLSISDGSRIPIEQRGGDEVLRGALGPVAPDGVTAWNPAFDITPSELITGWITERGLERPPFAR